MKLSIGNKLIGSFMALVLLLIVVGTAGYPSLGQVYSKIAGVTQASGIRHGNDQLLFTVASLRDAFTDYSLTRDESAKKDAAQFNEMIDIEMQELTPLIDDKGVLDIISETGRIRGNLYSAGEQMAALYHQGKNAEGSAAMKTFDRYAQTINENMQKLESYSEDRAEAARKSAENSKKIATFIIFGVSGLSVLIGVVLGIFLSRSISRPIIRMADTAGRIAEGDLSDEIETGRADEIGTLATAFSKMNGSLRSI
ncbi:MAG TPA: HAMP domain-containing protein, partial [Nitrospirota bacterium]|nr:HAMP domain-containing protein [Nitrospirota bacterium]